MFDSCFLLSSNGHVVYAGPQKLSLHYMAFVGFYKPPEENTADFLMDVIAGEHAAHPGCCPNTALTLKHAFCNRLSDDSSQGAEHI